MRKGEDPDPDPYWWLKDPDADPGGPKTYGSYGSGTLAVRIQMLGCYSEKGVKKLIWYSAKMWRLPRREKTIQHCSQWSILQYIWQCLCCFDCLVLALLLSLGWTPAPFFMRGLGPRIGRGQGRRRWGRGRGRSTHSQLRGRSVLRRWLLERLSLLTSGGYKRDLVG